MPTRAATRALGEREAQHVADESRIGRLILLIGEQLAALRPGTREKLLGGNATALYRL